MGCTLQGSGAVKCPAVVETLFLRSGEGRGWELSGPLSCSGRADRRYVAQLQATVAACLSEEVV